MECGGSALVVVVCVLGWLGGMCMLRRERRGGFLGAGVVGGEVAGLAGFGEEAGRAFWLTAGVQAGPRARRMGGKMRRAWQQLEWSRLGKPLCPRCCVMSRERVFQFGLRKGCTSDQVFCQRTLCCVSRF